jgi:transposase
MTANHGRQAIPTKLSEAQFEQFILPHLSRGRRGPPPTLPLQKMFNYALKALYMGCQWKMLPIETDALGLPEIHHTRIYRMMRRWQADGSIDRVFAGSVDLLHQDQRLDLSTIHGDGTATAAKKGGDNLGYSGHKHLKGDKVVAFCDTQLQHHRAIRECAGQPQRIAPAARRAAPAHHHGARHRCGPAGLNCQSGWRLRLSRKPQGDLQSWHEA